MLIFGEWFRAEDGITRPIAIARVQAADGTLIEEGFLIDSGADRTVFSAELMTNLRLSAIADLSVGGVGGMQNCLIVDTVIEFRREGGGTATVRGRFAGFTDPTATDMSVLGRDVLNNFDLIVSRPRNEVLMLAAPHLYRVERN